MKLSKNLSTGVVDSTVSDYLLTADNVVAVPRLTLDWNLNRYTTPTADNTPSEDTDGFDIETFPIESIYSPRRPTKGINKALVGQSVAATNYAAATDVKFYVGDQDDVYKYWTSPQPTDDSGIFPLHSDNITVVRPRVEYPDILQANKIVIKFETTWATPGDYNIQVKTTVAGNYSNVGGASPAIDNLGQCTLYYNGTAWVTTRPTTLMTTGVAGIQLVVRTMTGGTDRDGNPTTYLVKNYDTTDTDNLGTTTEFTTDGTNSNCNLISIEPRFEADFSDRLINETNTFDYSTTSFIYPIGTLTSNEGTITLSNDDGLLDDTNVASPYAGLLKQNVVVNLEYLFTIDGVQHSVQQYKMYAGLWAPQDDGTVQVPLTDYSKFLDEDKPNPFMWEKRSATELVWRILDSVGFVDYEIQVDDVTTDHTIPVFWQDGTKTVWAILDELTTATQMAVYFDENGMLQVKLRDAAFADDTPVAPLLGEDVGTNKSNIVSLNDSVELQSNKITVTYRTTSWKVGENGKAALDYVWQPDTDSLVVRSAPLIRDLSSLSSYIWIDQNKVLVWPYTSKVQIDGEIIQYDGKQYIYWTGNGTVRNSVFVKSLDDINKYKALSNNSKHKNYLSGALKITERGVWNSDEHNHLVESSNWDTQQFIYTGNLLGLGPNPRGFIYNRHQSTVTINTPGNMKSTKDLFLAYQGSTGQNGYNMYGTRIQFPTNGRPTQRAGIAFQLNGEYFDGYYVEIIPSNKIPNKDWKNTSEIQVWSRKNNKWTKLAKAHHVAVRPPRWYDIDVYVSRSSHQDNIDVFLNGNLVASATASGGDQQPNTARLAMYARGKTKATFEYFYAINRFIQEPEDDYGFWDLKNGGMRGGQWELEAVWKKRTKYKKRHKKKSTKNKAEWTGYLFDEFGPYVHEVREFDVTFDPAPVRYSQLYSTNTWEAAPVEYYSNAFKAHFVIANVSRTNAILKGDDTLLFNGSDAVTQVCAVLGRDLVVADDQSVVVTNDEAIRIDGEIETELTSDWIQSEAMANDIGNWIKQHWSLGVDQLQVTVFGNPCYQLGDVVSVQWSTRHMSSDAYHYFVVGAENTFDSGLATVLTLRRVNTAS